MKKSYTLLTSLILLLFAACNDEQVPGGEKGKRATFSVSVAGSDAQTRTVTNDDGTTDFVAGDCIGIFATKGADGVNVKHVVSSDGTVSSDEGVYFNGSGDATADFYAYYPYDETAAGTQVSFKVASDQDNEQRFNRSDFLTAVTTGVPVDTDQDVSLKFRHRLSQIQLEMVVSGNGQKPDSVLVNNCRTALVWDYLQDQCTTTGDAGSVKMWQQNTTGNPIFRALIPAQSIGAKTKLLSIHIGEKTYVFTTSADVALSGNSIKKFKIGIGSDDKLIVFSADITTGVWEEDTEVIEGEGTLVEPETLLEETDMENFTFTAVQKTKEEINARGWWKFHAYPERDVVEIAADPDDAARGMTMHFRRDTLSWHNGTFYYCAGEVVKGRYELKFKAKSSQTDNMKANQLRIGAYMQEFVTDDAGKTKNKDYYAIIENGETEVTTVYRQILTYDEYAEYTVIFNLGRVSTIHNGTAANVTDESKSVPTADLLKKVVLYLTPNKAGVDFHVDDISWKPVSE